MRQDAPTASRALAGVGIGWRDELAGFVGRRHGLGFVEVVAESIHHDQPLPVSLSDLLERGVPVIPHGVRLSLARPRPPALVTSALAERWGRRWSRAPAVAAVRERLRLGGLAPTPEQRARYRAAGLWFVPLLALGVARVAAGSANGRPVGFLVALLAVTVVVAAVLRPAGARRHRAGPAHPGRLRAETRRPPVGASPAELGMATALFGAGVLWAADVETALALRVPREHGAYAGGHVGGEGGGGSGGSCGGGGCGGGGCGG